MPSNIHEEASFDASAHDVFEALVDPDKFRKWTGAKEGDGTTTGRKTGDAYSAWGGYGTGTIVSAVTDHSLVHTFVAKGWDEGVVSTMSIAIIGSADGKTCSVVFDQLNAGWPSSEEKKEAGKADETWDKYYWAPLRKYLAETAESSSSAAGAGAGAAAAASPSKRARTDDEDGDGEAKEGAPHTCCHFDIPVKDIERAKTFYTAVHGWEYKQWMPAYALTMAPGSGDGKPGVNGGLYVADGDIPSEKGVTVHILDEDIDTALKRVVAAGGTVEKEKYLIAPQIGYNALYKDTEGNTIGIFQAP